MRRLDGARQERGAGFAGAGAGKSFDVYSLPADLPVPEDDGAADHLVGLELPDLTLPSSQGEVNVRDFAVIYVYPRSGKPGVPPLEGWDETPGARGCTPQSCAFRDRFPDFGVPVAGLSAQPLEDQLEFAARNRMPFPVIADPEGALGAALRLPTFEILGFTLYKRLTLVAENARIVKVFYPVFPPDANAGDVLAWLHASRSGTGEAGASAPVRAPSSLRPS